MQRYDLDMASPKTTVPDRRIDVGDVTLVWGDKTRWKARLRDEAWRQHLARPLEQRLRAALALVLPARGNR